MKILHIHGFNGKAKGSTFESLSRLFPHDELIAEQFDLLDIEGVYRRIDEVKPDLLTGNSLGGFYALTWKGNCRKIVINPCLVPSVEIPKLDSSVTQSVIDGWKAIEQKFAVQPDAHVFGIFGRDDELFHYKEMFDRLFPSPSSSSLLVEGKHQMKKRELAGCLPTAVSFVIGEKENGIH